MLEDPRGNRQQGRFHGLKLLLVAAIFLLTQLGACKQKGESATSETSGTVVQFCPPFQSPLERSLWVSLVLHPVAKKLFRNYMSCTQKPVRLTGQEMTDIDAEVEWSESRDITKKIDALRARASRTKKMQRGEEFRSTLVGHAYGGTLGRFSIHFAGHLEYVPDDGEGADDVLLVGNISYEDFWDFDAKALGERKQEDESRTRIAGKFMSGRGFPVTSEVVPGQISSSQGTIQLLTYSRRTPSPEYSERAKWLVEKIGQNPKHSYSVNEILRLLSQSFGSTHEHP